MADLNILIQAKLDEGKTTQEINRQLTEIQKKLSTLKLDLKIDGAIVEKMKSVSQNAQQVTQSVQQQAQATAQQAQMLDKLATTYSGMGSQVEGMTRKVKEWTDEDGKHFKLVQNINKETQEITSTIQTETQDYKKLGEEIGRAREQAEKLRQSQEKAAQKEAESASKEQQRLQERQIIALGEQKMLEQQAAEAQKKLQESLDSQKFRLGNKMDVFGVRSSGLYDKSAFESLRKELDGLSVSAPDAKQKLDQIGRSFETMNVQAQKGAVDLRAYGQSWEKSLTTAFSKMLLWAAAGDLLFSSIHFFTKGIAYVNDLNKSLTEISIVTGKNQKQISDLGLEYQKLASEMAVSTKEIANASVTFFRQGLDQVSVMERIRVATEYAKVANLDFAQSSELLTAAVNSMDLPIQRVADVFNLLGDLTSTGPDELGIAFQKVGGTVQSANIEFEKMASWISTISARTREAPSSIGDAMKSMLARFMNITQNGFDEEEGGNINDVSTALKSVGVELVNAEGNFNDFGKIVDQLGAKWDTLDSRTRAYLGTALAGKFCPAM